MSRTHRRGDRFEENRRSRHMHDVDCDCRRCELANRQASGLSRKVVNDPHDPMNTHCPCARCERDWQRDARRRTVVRHDPLDANCVCDDCLSMF